ncbi:MAG: RagB/SusD family nutrient uptake outer membrane protein [Prevotellaceae bacterium]|nr:RagB/SusD family nutrient uptake outer membrane protein [Prevotellaceae bacterium]
MKKYIIILFSAMLITSCGNDWLEQYPHSSLSDEQAILSLRDAQIAVTGIYNGTKGAGFYGREIFVAADVCSEDVVLRTDNSNRYVANYRWQLQAGISSSIWTTGYTVIHRANEVLKRLPALNLVPGETEEQRNQLLGEAYFMRAMIHFEIIKFYAQPYNFTNDASHLGIPYMLEPSRENDVARETVKVCFDNIIKDAEEALTLMNIDKQSDPYAAGKDVVNAFLARLYLYMAGPSNGAYYAKAKDYAEIVINSGRYRLATAAEYEIKGGGVAGNPYVSEMWGPSSGYSMESIFTIAYKDVSGERNQTDALGRIYLDKSKAYGDLLSSVQIQDLVGYNDENNKDVRKSMLYTYDGKVAVRKFMGDGSVSWDLSNINIFRISEMYLIAAEGWAKGTSRDEGKALAHLNSLRTKRGLSALNDLIGSNLTDEILRERRRELCFEGHGLIDHKRLNTSIVRTADPVNPENPNLGMVYPNNFFALGIPSGELNVNKLIVQNPGY